MSDDKCDCEDKEAKDAATKLAKDTVSSIDYDKLFPEGERGIGGASAGEPSKQYINPLADGGTHPAKKEPRTSSLSPDIEAYIESHQQCLKVFADRKKQHGDHLQKTLQYHIFELYGKCERLQSAVLDNRIPSDDLLIDLSNYCNMIRSHPSFITPIDSRILKVGDK